MVRLMGSVRRTCTRLGTLALVSLFLSLAVMTFLVDTPHVLRWFLASAACAAVAYAGAVLAAYFEE